MLAATKSPTVRSRKNLGWSIPFEMLEQRQLLSGFAPTSIAGSSIAAAITAGTAPLSTVGSYTIQPQSTGAYAIVNAAGGAANDSGTFDYVRSTDSTGIFQFTNALGVAYNDTLSFSSATGGTYSIIPLASGGTDTQTGSFTFTPANAPVAPDLTIGFVQSPTNSVVAGDKGFVIVSVSNQGTAIASGGATVSLSVTPTGGMSDRTAVTGNPVQLHLHLKPGISQNARVSFKYPNVVTGSYLFAATVTASAALPESDTSNNTAISAQSVQITSAVVDVAATSLTISGIPKSGAVSGGKANAIVTLKNAGNQILSGGPVSISMFAADNAQGIGETSVLPTPIKGRLQLGVGKSENVHVKFSLPNVNATTDEFFFATVSTVGGTIVETAGADANNTIGTALPLSVASPVVTLRDVLQGKAPASVIGGKAGQATVRVYNDGNVQFHGNVPITVAVSTDDVIADGTVVKTVDPTLAIAPNRFANVPINFMYPSNLANANYNLLAQSGATTTPVTGAVPPISIDVPASNVTVSASAVNITQPYASLNAVFDTLPATAFTANQHVVVKLTLFNNGNAAAVGPVTVQLIASPSSDPNDVGATVLMPVQHVHLNLRSDGQTVLTFNINKMPALAAGTNYLFLAPIDASGITGITDPMIVAVSPVTFVVT
jgi:CARDB